MTIRPATPDDLPQIAVIQGRSSWEPAGYLKYNCIVAVENSRVAGFLASRETTAGEREILNLVVDPACRRRGMARALLSRELESFHGTWFLEVRESNAAAIGLYQASGFRPVGRRLEYYSDPLEAGIVMRFFS
jgi:ribosomal-protein-alanine N-acetyltransferase